MLMTVEKKFLTSMFLSNKAIVQQSSIRIVHRSVSACAHTTLFTLTSERFKMGFGGGGGGGGEGAKICKCPPSH